MDLYNETDPDAQLVADLLADADAKVSKSKKRKSKILDVKHNQDPSVDPLADLVADSLAAANSVPNAAPNNVSNAAANSVSNAAANNVSNAAVDDKKNEHNADHLEDYVIPEDTTLAGLDVAGRNKLAELAVKAGSVNDLLKLHDVLPFDDRAWNRLLRCSAEAGNEEIFRLCVSYGATDWNYAMGGAIVCGRKQLVLECLKRGAPKIDDHVMHLAKTDEMHSFLVELSKQ